MRNPSPSPGLSRNSLKTSIIAVALLYLLLALVSCTPTKPAETTPISQAPAPTRIAQSTSPAVPTATNTTRSTPTLTTEPTASATRARSTSSPTPSKVADRPSSPYPPAATRTPTLTPNPVIRSGSPTSAIATKTPVQPSPTATETLPTSTFTATSSPSATPHTGDPYRRANRTNRTNESRAGLSEPGFRKTRVSHPRGRRLESAVCSGASRPHLRVPKRWGHARCRSILGYIRSCQPVR